jgi:predicted TIM-barrel fold metal-dependent hydrolase
MGRVCSERKNHHVLWFDNQAEEAAEFYASVFEDGRVPDVARYGEGTYKASSPGYYLFQEQEAGGCEKLLLAVSGDVESQCGGSMKITGPLDDDEIPEYLHALGIPGLADVHVHFLPEPMMRKVWTYFDRAEENYGRPWPIQYRTDEQSRLARLREFGLKAIPALSYAHKPGMAQWLNDWSLDFSRRIPDALHCATLYPEPEVGRYVRGAIDSGAQLFKVHVKVGGFAPESPLLNEAWEALESAAIPVVIHAGSAPLAGTFTGPEHVRRLLSKFPGLVLIIAHMGMPEYDAFADLALDYPKVFLDTTMVGTDFTNGFAPMPDGYLNRLSGLQDRIILGSDFPNIPYAYAHQLEALDRLGLGDDWLRAVLWENGARLLDLPAVRT